MLRQFSVSIIITILATLGAGIWFGLGAAGTTLILIAIEVAFSFDNAVINAKTLGRLSDFWRRLFLTLGMVIAVLGMRLLFPVFIVTLTAQLGWRRVVDLALHHPATYAHYLQTAHTSIAAFGGGFLLVLALYFLFDHEREIVWLQRIERPLQRLRSGHWLPPVIGIVVLGLVALLAPHVGRVAQAGVAGVVTYTLIHNGIQLLGRLTGQAATSVSEVTGWAALTAFIYLEILDASFSFDGVLGAFAITSSVPLIALGLGVGALWVRSLTVYMVAHGTLDAYQFLEHGAHYAILALAVALLGSLFVDIPDAITGLTGLAIIGAAFYGSLQANKLRA